MSKYGPYYHKHQWINVHIFSTNFGRENNIHTLQSLDIFFALLTNICQSSKNDQKIWGPYLSKYGQYYHKHRWINVHRFSTNSGRKQICYKTLHIYNGNRSIHFCFKHHVTKNYNTNYLLSPFTNIDSRWEITQKRDCTIDAREEPD